MRWLDDVQPSVLVFLEEGLDFLGLQAALLFFTFLLMKHGNDVRKIITHGDKTVSSAAALALHSAVGLDRRQATSWTASPLNQRCRTYYTRPTVRTRD